jgi:hypothetical protein
VSGNTVVVAESRFQKVFVLFCFGDRTAYVAQAGLELPILLSAS